MNIWAKKIETEEEKKQVFSIREEVFVVEQKVDRNTEYDIYEDTANHFLAFDNQSSCGAGRWRFTEKGIKIERFAVLAKHRNKGVASTLLKTILADISQNENSGNQTVYLHAQVQAIHLYQQFGFVVKGDIFLEENIEHFYMEKQRKDKNISQKIGFLGGGQLGRMLIQAGINLDLDISILDADPEAPCRNIASHFELGKITDFDTVYNFGQKAEVISIEIENVNTEALEKLAHEGKKVYPQPTVIKTIKNKRLQKQFYQKNNIPTPDFILVENKAEVEANIDFFPCFQKLGEGGYDGKGVQKLSTQADLEKAFDAPSLLEKAIDIEKEISVIVARNPSGEMQSFPAVESVFDPKYNLVDYLIAPAQISSEVQTKAQNLAKKLMQTFDMVGILAIEMFLLADNSILVNEVAPRPHNSGHHSIEANNVSQFEQHLRAILDLPLQTPQTIHQGIMLNIIGADLGTGEASYEGLEEVLRMENVYIHLYGKKITKPGRKMGHITILGNDLKKMQEKVDFIRNVLICKPV